MKKIILSLVAPFVPAIAFAQGQVNQTYVTSIVNLLQYVVQKIFPLLTIIAVGFFFWELISYIRATAEEKAKTRSGLLYSILALFIMLSFFGIVKLLQQVTGVTGGGVIESQDIPQVDF